MYTAFAQRGGQRVSQIVPARHLDVQTFAGWIDVAAKTVAVIDWTARMRAEDPLTRNCQHALFEFWGYRQPAITLHGLQWPHKTVVDAALNVNEVILKIFWLD